MRSATLSRRTPQRTPAPHALSDTELVLSGDVLRDLDPWPLTVATYNIHGAVGTDGRVRARAHRPGVTGDQGRRGRAAGSPLGGSAQPDVLTLLKEEIGFFAVEGPTMQSEERRYGNAVLSRYPILAKESIDLSFGSREPRGALDADIDCHGHMLRVIATHLGLKPAERRDQIKRLLQAFDTDQAP
jgi:endonuclease/exonuclease/phosphatase family metal-dependent hydrolase